MLTKFIIFISCCVCFVLCGCRNQERKACEAICQKGPQDKMICELRGAIILPNLPNIEASLPRVSEQFHSPLIFQRTTAKRWFYRQIFRVHVKNNRRCNNKVILVESPIKTFTNILLLFLHDASCSDILMALKWLLKDEVILPRCFELYLTFAYVY